MAAKKAKADVKAPEKKNAWLGYSEKVKKDVFKLNEGYKKFISDCKTERECVTETIRMAEANGYVDLNTVIAENKELKAGDKVYFNNRGKTVAFAVIGKDAVESGVNITAAHIDSPRLDLKPNPLYEELELALFKTHYYGGIKKYQWTNIPLSIHGTVVKPNGEKVTICIGEKEEDPIFTISDLLPHLAAEQMERKLKDGVQGEELNVLVGSIPYEAEDVSERVKLNILNMLNERYGIKEVDFASSEIELVPINKL